jgi:hypothetical protein
MSGRKISFEKKYMQEYSEIIGKINDSLVGFSDYLKPEFSVSSFNETKLNDPKLSWRLKEVGWNDTMFPGDESHGVYFIFGKSTEQNDKLGLYVGKASMSLIGNRLYSHLSHGSKDMNYFMRDAYGNVFSLDFVTTIPLKETSFLAPALEEYLIDKLQNNEVYLLNAIGKK